MFISKWEKEEIWKRLNNFVTHEEDFNHGLPDNIVSCEKCKCLIKKEDAVKGKSEIRLRANYTIETRTIEIMEGLEHKFKYKKFRDPEYIYHPYYCHRCVPKGKEKK